MINDQIVDYISHELAHGTSEPQIRHALVTAGWKDEDVSENFLAARQRHAISPVIHENEPQEKRAFLKRHAKAVVALVLACLFLAGGAFGAYKFIPPSPEKMFQQAFLNFGKVNSLDFSGNINADVDAPSELLNLQAFLPGSQELADQMLDSRVAGAGVSNVQFAMSFKGSLDATDEKKPKAQLRMDVTSGIFTFGLESRVIEDTVYFKLDKIPKLTEAITKYDNTWIKIDTSDSAKEEIDKLPIGQPNLTEGQKKQIQDLQAQAHFYNSLTKLPNDSIDGVPMYHYAVELDKVGIKNYYEQLERIQTAAGGSVSSTSKALDSVIIKNVEIWIGKSDRNIHRISGQINEAPSNDSIPVSGSIHFMFSFSNFNQIAPIAAPADYKIFEDVLKDVMTPPAVPPVQP